VSVLIDNIGSLVTNDPELGEGPLGLIEDAALVLGGGVVVWAGPRASVPEGAAAERVDAQGRAVIPGFVDSHAHLVFAGDRSREFAARVASTVVLIPPALYAVPAIRAANSSARSPANTRCP